MSDRIFQRIGDILVSAETLDGTVWVVSSTGTDGECLSISNIRGPRAAFEAGREYQRDIEAAFYSSRGAR